VVRLPFPASNRHGTDCSAPRSYDQLTSPTGWSTTGISEVSWQSVCDLTYGGNGMRRIGDVLIERQVSFEPKLDRRRARVWTFSPVAGLRFKTGQRIKAGDVQRCLTSRRQCPFRAFFRGRAAA
jgi:hypothetical protein